MKGKKRKLKIFFYIDLLIIAMLVGYKGYLYLFKTNFEALNVKNISEITEMLGSRESFSFAVIGNIHNSIGVFEKKIVPRINSSEASFMISVGNAVSDGGEDKYISIYSGLEMLNIPYVLTFGVNEYSNFGSFKFYEYFGPYYFSFKAGSTHFIFLDTTKKTSFIWQKKWLSDKLAGLKDEKVFVFMCKAPLEIDVSGIFGNESDYISEEDRRKFYQNTFSRFNVDAVFADNLGIYHRKEINGVTYLVTGGGGGFVLDDERSFYHFLKVNVSGDKVSYEVVRIGASRSGFVERLENLWLFIHSLFYVGFLNFLLILCLFLLIAVKLYDAVFVEKNYYQDFDIDPELFAGKKINVAMFTNNYLPFIGGVPVSIHRLKTGLKKLGNRVLIFAPDYGEEEKGDKADVYRVKSLFHYSKFRDFPVANIFSGKIYKRLKIFNPDIIHVHHPFWMGRKGYYMAKKLNVPLVFTYHTRLELYAHYVPLPGMLFRNLISHYMVRKFANRCDGVVVPTYSAEEYLRAVGVKTHITVLPTGIDFKKFESIDKSKAEEIRSRYVSDNEYLLVTVSRLGKEKNLDFLLDTIAFVKEKADFDFRLIMLGEGPYRDELEKKIDALNLGSTVFLTGAVEPDDMGYYYSAADLFVFTSKSETQGMVILEAMSAGLPVLSVRSSGIDDVVQNDFTGYKTKEDPKVWLEKLEKILTDKKLYMKLSANAQDFASHYSTDEIAGKMHEFYARLLAGRQSDKNK
ncbi:glycosyltransferase family 4 protein [Flexistipes sp.]|uniref:glycosyltransferase family 4 protein n=1 Tax=Flexistipes sp. TaxID=3088135 RepID=UPI002E1B11A7|nr:glycosyltransferase family 4 protein [Flexistipes sp.]